MSNEVYVGTDRNGTKIYHDYTCNKCGGKGGSDAWKFTGWTCYKCGGTGRMDKPEVTKIYTPEYQAKLDARRQQKELKRIETLKQNSTNFNQEFVEKHFSGNDSVYVIKGNTYNIKDKLKEEGCRFVGGLGWYSPIKTDRQSWEINIEDLLTKNVYGEYEFKDYETLKDMVKTLVLAETKPSEYYGEVGSKVEVKVTLSFLTSYEIRSFAGYGTDTIYLANMKDSDGNVFVWKSGTAHKANVDGEFIITGTVKEHSVYDKVKQTVLTRCKIKGGLLK